MNCDKTARDIYLIGAMADNRVAGGDSGMPWHAPEDLRRFRELTYGHSVIMGRRTWDTLTAPLPGRQNIVLCARDSVVATTAMPSPIVTPATSLNEAIRSARLPGAIFVIGGEGPWAEALECASRVYLTRLYATFPGNVLFPELNARDWTETQRISRRGPVNGTSCNYDFLLFERRVIRQL